MSKNSPRRARKVVNPLPAPSNSTPMKAIKGKVVPLPLEMNAPLSPQLGSFGVLVVVLDVLPSARSADMLEKLSGNWGAGKEVVFLSTNSNRVAKQMVGLFPKLFYNRTEPLGLASLWRLLPWRVVLLIKAGQVCCLTPGQAQHKSSPNPQPKGDK